MRMPASAVVVSDLLLFWLLQQQQQGQRQQLAAIASSDEKVSSNAHAVAPIHLWRCFIIILPHGLIQLIARSAQAALFDLSA